MVLYFQTVLLILKRGVEIAADDSVLQMVTISSRKHLEDFIESPSPRTVSPLVTIPALYRTITFENHHHGQCSTTLIAICRWIADEAKRVLESIRLDTAPGVDVTAMVLSGDWRKVWHYVHRDYTGSDLILILGQL